MGGLRRRLWWSIRAGLTGSTRRWRESLMLVRSPVLVLPFELVLEAPVPSTAAASGAASRSAVSTAAAWNVRPAAGRVAETSVPVCNMVFRLRRRDCGLRRGAHGSLLPGRQQAISTSSIASRARGQLIAVPTVWLLSSASARLHGATSHTWDWVWVHGIRRQALRASARERRRWVMLIRWWISLPAGPAGSQSCGTRRSAVGSRGRRAIGRPRRHMRCLRAIQRRSARIRAQHV